MAQYLPRIKSLPGFTKEQKGQIIAHLPKQSPEALAIFFASSDDTIVESTLHEKFIEPLHQLEDLRGLLPDEEIQCDRMQIALKHLLQVPVMSALDLSESSQQWLGMFS